MILKRVTDEMIVEYVYKQKEQCDIVIAFNDLLFSSSEINKFLEEHESEDDYLEFLPCISFKKVRKYDSVTDLSAFARLLSYKMRDKVLHENQVIRIKIENNSDDIK